MSISKTQPVIVENLTKNPKGWGAWQLPPFGTGELPWEIASRLRDNPNFRVILDGLADLFPIVDGRGVNLTFLAPVDIRDGYGSCSPFMAMALERAGFYLHFKSIRYYNGDHIPKRAMELLERPSDDETHLGLTMTWPLVISRGSGAKKWGYTMFETDHLPDDWVRAANQTLGVFVPSKQNAEAFRDSGVTVPVYPAPLGVDGDLWPIHDRSKEREKRPYTFGFFGTCTGRKNPKGAIEAFHRAFPNETDVRFVWKTRVSQFGNGGMTCVNLIANDPRCTIIDKNYTPEEIVTLLHNEIDCLVFPSLGEGFGLPPLQAMATGLPVIVAANSGMLEYCDDQYNYSVKDNPKVKADEYPEAWGDVGNWWKPNTEELSHLMRHVYDNREEAHAKGMKAAEWVRHKFTWDATAHQIVRGMTATLPNLPKMLREHPPIDRNPNSGRTVKRPADMFVNVFVMAYGQALMTANAINDTHRALQTNGIGCRFWLLDQGSPVESSVWLMFEEYHKGDPEKFVIIHGDENIGVGAGRAALLNAWMQRGPETPHECGLIIDNDIRWHDTAGFGRMCDVLWKPGVMVVGCEGVYVPPRGSGAYWIPCTNPAIMGEDVDSVSGAVQLFHRQMVERFGVPFDGRVDGRVDLVRWHEDSEYVLRARKAGYRVQCIGGTGFQHLMSQTTALIRGENHGVGHDEDLQAILEEYWRE